MEKMYKHKVTGYVANEDSWFFDYISMGIVAWYGKPAYEITDEEAANWLAGGGLIEVVKDESGDGWSINL